MLPALNPEARCWSSQRAAARLPAGTIVRRSAIGRNSTAAPRVAATEIDGVRKPAEPSASESSAPRAAVQSPPSPVAQSNEAETRIPSVPKGRCLLAAGRSGTTLCFFKSAVLTPRSAAASSKAASRAKADPFPREVPLLRARHPLSKLSSCRM